MNRPTIRSIVRPTDRQTKHFHDITLIEDAVHLYAKLKGSITDEQFDAAADEEYEDSEGHVLNRRTYEDLARQGLL